MCVSLSVGGENEIGWRKQQLSGGGKDQVGLNMGGPGGSIGPVKFEQSHTQNAQS